uniref:Uncharacterized protein n=1 Tax=Amanita thiersii TaxID=235537 RepID=A0A5Q0N2H0_9AGAR|nr:hypothetical protein [Amanita thiersii]QFZ98732.1 hypothetical protein [Amanita thiersii]
MSTSNLSNMNNDDNKEKLLSLKEKIEVNTDSTTTIPTPAVNINAEDLLKNGVNALGKSIEGGVTQAAYPLGLPQSIGADFIVGAAICAGQSPINRLATTVGCGLAEGAIHVGATSISRSLVKK